MNDNEPKSELARYAYGYTDRKPGLTFWVPTLLLIAIGVYIIAFNGLR